MYKYQLKYVFLGLRITAGMDITCRKHIFIVFVINKFTNSCPNSFQKKTHKGPQTRAVPKGPRTKAVPLPHSRCTECGAEVVRLRRHLNSVHRDLTNDQREFEEALNSRKTVQRNRSKCPVPACGKFPSRLPNHLRQVHKLPSGSLAFTQYMRETQRRILRPAAPAVPAAPVEIDETPNHRMTVVEGMG